MSLSALLRFSLAAAVATSLLSTASMALNLRVRGEQQFNSEQCTPSQEDDIEYYNGEYDTSSCEIDQCSSDCLEVITNLYLYMPDCVSADGSNYSELMAKLLEKCSASPGNRGNGGEGVVSGSSSIDQGACTSDQEKLTDEALEVYLTGACVDTTTCTSECLSDLTTLYEILPDCTYSDSINYFADIAEWLGYCDMVDDDSTDATDESKKVSKSTPN